MMQLNAVATVVRRVLKIDSPPSNAPACKRAANDGPTTRQLHFAYRPVIAEKPSAGATAELLDRWLQDRSASMAAALPMPDFRDFPDVLNKADRFFLGHAASALKNLQSVGMAGCTVVHLSTSCLTDPLFPGYVISLLQLRGVRLNGVDVTLGARGPIFNTARESPTCVRYHTDDDMRRQAS